MLDAIFRPVHQWPGKKTSTYSRKRGLFRVNYAARLDLLEKELNYLNAKDVLIQAYFDSRNIRNDGWPRSSARPTEPGIILTYLVGKQTFSLPCDTYESWDDNLYAIALSLEALRAVDRYGVTKTGEQYQGFRQLEAPKAVDPSQSALQFIAKHAGVSADETRQNVDVAYRLAARKVHPDQGGTNDLFVQLQAHYKTLKASA